MIDQIQLGIDLGGVFLIWFLFFIVSWFLRAVIWAGF